MRHVWFMHAASMFHYFFVSGFGAGFVDAVADGVILASAELTQVARNARRSSRVAKVFSLACFLQSAKAGLPRKVAMSGPLAVVVAGVSACVMATRHSVAVMAHRARVAMVSIVKLS